MTALDRDVPPRVMESEYAAIAHALEVVAEAAGSPVRAEDAMRAVRRCRRACASSLEAAEVAAAELGLSVRRRSPQADRVVAIPSVAVLDDGRWLVATARRGHRVLVSLVDARTVAAETLSFKELDTLTRGGEVLHFSPRLALQDVSAQSRPKLRGRPWLRLRAFLGIEKRDLGVVAVYAVVIGLLTLATPVAVQAVVNSVAFGSTLQPLVVLTLLLFGGLSFSAMLRLLEAYVVEVLQRRYFVRVADDFGRRLASVPVTEHDKRFGPELVNRFFDIVAVQKSLSTLLLDGLSLALQTGVGMILLGFYHPLLLSFNAVLVTLLILVIFLGRGALPTANNESVAKYKVGAWLEDVARAPRLFVGASARDHAWNRSDILARDYVAARKSHFRVLLRQLSGGMFLQVLAVVSLLGVGGYLVLTRQLTLGQLVAAELIVTAMGAGFSKVGKNLEKFYDLGVGVMKIGAVLDQPTERVGGERPHGSGPLQISAGAVSVSRGGRTLIRNVTRDIEAGSRVLIDGDAGVGKTSLLEVLGGVRMPAEGGIQHDGLDLRRADLGSIRDFTVVVGQPEFVAASVLDNLFLGGVPLPEPDTRRLLRLLEMEDAVDALPKGLDEPMTPHGSPFSERQQRRLSLIRGIAHQPRALLIDRGLDGLALPDAAMGRLLDELFDGTAPWTLVVVSDDDAVRRRCTSRLRIVEGALEVVS
ncbi:MAG: ATP-binding cassette domain-containing protein [Nannocystales bacterium]